MAPGKMARTLRGLRESRGLTQVQLAKKARISQAYVAKLESGARKSLSLPAIKRLAKALGVPVTELLE
jgi:transcriptional regulator with XRE-family HTH domain